MQTARHFHQWRIKEVPLELLCFQRSTHDYQLHVWSLFQHLPAEQPLNMTRKQRWLQLFQHISGRKSCHMPFADSAKGLLA